VIGTIWIIFTRPDIGLFGVGINSLDLLGHPLRSYRPARLCLDHPDAMEVWHWTPLVALLAYAGLRAIPEAYYQAAKIDGASAWAVFRYIQLPKMRGVLTIAVLLRWMDSFLIYAEPFVLTGGGAGQFHHLFVHLPGQAGHRPVRPGTGGGLFADLFSHRAAVQLHLLPGAPERGKGEKCHENPQKEPSRCSSISCCSSCPSTGCSTCRCAATPTF
jgi:hypothetical protein